MSPPHPTSLFTVPLEIRRQIYRELWGSSTHLFAREGQLLIMPCYGADDSWRRPEGDVCFRNPTWARRVESHWGCHWRCDEEYLNGVHRPEQASHMPLLPVLLSSKAIHSDVMNFLCQPTQCVNFTDLETIDRLLSNHHQPHVSTTSTPSALPTHGLSSLTKAIKNIDFTLRLPIMLLATLYVPWYSKPGRRGDFATMPPRPHATLEGSGYKREHEQWTRIWPALQALPGLQRFNLWLDHIEDHPWDTVCEREILQGLSDIMPSLKSRNVRVTVNLPRLPSEALMAPFTDEESFTDEEYFLNKPPEFELQRRTRLPWIALSLGPIYPDIVGWAENRENGSIPAGFEGGQSVLVEQVWTNFAMMGYSVYCEEFRNHPVLGDFYDDGFQSQWDYI